jgi:hypothetical protein
MKYPIGLMTTSQLVREALHNAHSDCCADCSDAEENGGSCQQWKHKHENNLDRLLYHHNCKRILAAALKSIAYGHWTLADYEDDRKDELL